jgi:hypothetical protein
VLPAPPARSAAGNAACRIASASALAGAMPAKLGVGSVPWPATELGVEDVEELVPAALAEAAAWCAALLALCAETASQAPIAITKGIRKPAKSANAFQPIPVSLSVWRTEYVLMTPPRLDSPAAP